MLRPLTCTLWSVGVRAVMGFLRNVVGMCRQCGLPVLKSRVRMSWKVSMQSMSKSLQTSGYGDLALSPVGPRGFSGHYAAAAKISERIRDQKRVSAHFLQFVVSQVVGITSVYHICNQVG